MNNDPAHRVFFIKAALQLLPPSISDSILNDDLFLSNFETSLESDLIIGHNEARFKISSFFQSIREYFKEKTHNQVYDLEQRAWKIDQKIINNTSLLFLSREEKEFVLQDYLILSSENGDRIKSLETNSKEVNLSKDSIEKWNKILSERPLEDYEVFDYYDDLGHNPVSIIQKIKGEANSGHIQIETLVPPSKRYFERLVGNYEGSTSIQQYYENSLNGFIEQTINWDPLKGLFLCLYLSGDSAITNQFPIEKLGVEQVEKAYSFIVDYGDPISHIGVIETGLRILSKNPFLEDHIRKIIDQICDDSKTNLYGHSNNISSFINIFVFVDGELSRTKVLSSCPPFYRRLGALAQSSLILSTLNQTKIDTEKFCKWAYDRGINNFYTQNFVDMRSEPRWSPDYIEKSHFHEAFLRRIIEAASMQRDNINETKLFKDYFVGEATKFELLKKSYASLFPGPLSGKSPFQNALPQRLQDDLNKKIKSHCSDTSFFIPFINSALLYSTDDVYIVNAIQILKENKYRISRIANSSELESILIGLASVAAVKRSKSLADELRILDRKYRRDIQFKLSVKVSFEVCLITAASIPDEKGWRNFIGDWITELAFSDLTKDDGDFLLAQIQLLITKVPEFWITCGRALAALKAFLQK